MCGRVSLRKLRGPAKGGWPLIWECCGFASRPGHFKDHHKNGTNCLPAWHACVRVGVSKRQGTVWNCLWGHALRSPDINPKSSVLYPVPGFLSIAT